MPKASKPDPGSVVLTDPRAIVALAHPARLTIIDALYAGDELTATQAGALTGLSASAASYHLRALQKWGIVQRADASGDARERPWRACGDSLRVESTDTRVAGASKTSLLSTVLDRDRSAVLEFVQHQDAEQDEWRDALSLVSGKYWLTAGEVQTVLEELKVTLDAYRDRRLTRNRPEGSRPVRISIAAIPQ